MLIGGAALVTFGSAGALWVVLRSADSSEWIEAVVRKNLPNVRLDEASLSSFAAGMARAAEFRSKKIALAVELDALAPTVVRLAPEVQEKIERLERVVMSEFLIRSNFFRVDDPRTQTIVCGEALPACANPFAVFRTA
jgi:hypothetical protein